MPTFRRYIYWTTISSLVGVFAGITSALFLITLEWVTLERLNNPNLILGLPIAGLLSGFLYLKFGGDVNKGNNLILEEIHNPKKIIPLRMTPFIYFGTILTHLCGGSAGREGTAVQMSASLADQVSHFFKVTKEERKILLTAGIGAGFGTALGVPWAGALFGMEVLHVEKIELHAWYECTVASFVGCFVAALLKAPHAHFPALLPVQTHWSTYLWIIIAGCCFGLAAKVFVNSTHFVEKKIFGWVKYQAFKPFLGGLLIISLFYLHGSLKYAGLGIAEIQQSLSQVGSLKDPLFKTFYSSLTLGSGFKGGEFVPLVFIGTSLGSALSVFIPVSLNLLASLGFASVFAGAANTPIACSVMAIEIFGANIAPFAFIACFASYYASGNSGIYKAQILTNQKHTKLKSFLSYLGNLPNHFFSKK